MAFDWDPSECSLKILSEEIVGIDDFEAPPGDELTQVESATGGVECYNEGHQKPTWKATVKLSNTSLDKLETARVNKTEGTVVFTAPGYTATVTGARIKEITPASGLKEMPTVTISGLGKKVERSFAR